jgi:Flp pilus assembly protein TadD
LSPADNDASRFLGNLFVQKKRFAEAVPPLEAAVKLNPQDFPATAGLASAYMLSGKVEDGRATMKRAMELGPAALVLNNVAFALANANQDLPDALQYAQKAVHDEELASQKVNLSSLENSDLQYTVALASYWDTLGWVYFRLEQLDQADVFLSAAWQLSQYAVVADHLAQLYEQQHKTKDAVHMYLLAPACPCNPRTPPARRASG